MQKLNVPWMLPFAIGALLIGGCSESKRAVKEDVESPPRLVDFDSPAQGDFGDDLIINIFGMRFIRVEIDAGRSDSMDDSDPGETYYLQQGEVVWSHLQALRAYGRAHGIGPEGYLNIDTSQARDYADLAALMSRYDPHFDYGLPSKAQWVFACTSGYDRRCEPGGENAYGFVDMLDDGDVEVTDELSVLMGQWINNWGEHTGKPKPECPCEYWTRCNPDADDSLDEIIVGRFTLLPEGSVGD